MGTRTEINSEDDIDAMLHVMLDFGDNDLTENLKKFKESLPAVIQFINNCLAGYGDQIEVDEVSDERIECTLSIVNCPVGVELEITPSLYWDNDDGK